MFKDGISKHFKAESKAGKKSGRDTSLMSGGLEAWKLVPLLVHFAFSLGSDGSVVPSTKRYLRSKGVVDSRVANPTDVILSACASCFEMHKALDAKTMLYDDHQRILYLISAAKYHHVRLNVLKRLCWMIKINESPTPQSLIDTLYKKALAGNKHHYMFHLLFAKLHLGCNLMYMDTEMSELSNKPFVKEPFNHSSKRLASRLKEMLSYILKKKLASFLRPLVKARDEVNAKMVEAAPGIASAGARHGVSAEVEAVPDSRPVAEVDGTGLR